MATRIAINGFGRIGRVVTRLLAASQQSGQPSAWSDLELVAINDLTGPETLAHLLRYDSVHRRFPGEVKAEGGALVINGRSVKVSAERDPAKLPWRDEGVDITLECTGVFRSREQASAHLSAGARKVIISAPSNDPDITIAYGVNSDSYDASRHDVVSCASCTTNCLAPVAKVLLDTFGIVRGCMTTVHSYTNDQQVLDLPHKDLRRARAAALSQIPTTTGAAKAVGLVLPQLKGKVDGFAIRVPTPNVSVVDFVAELGRDTSVEEVNSALNEASQSSLKGVLDFTTEELVSSDFLGSTASATVDAGCTMVIEKRMAKVIAWYDNEVGFSARMLDVSSMMGKSLRG